MINELNHVFTYVPSHIKISNAAARALAKGTVKLETLAKSYGNAFMKGHDVPVRQLDLLGQGAEGVAHVVSHPNPTGIAVRKTYDMKSPIVSPESIRAKKDIFQHATRNTPLAHFFGEDRRSPNIHYLEHLKEKKDPTPIPKTFLGRVANKVYNGLGEIADSYLHTRKATKQVSRISKELGHGPVKDVLPGHNVMETERGQVIYDFIPKREGSKTPQAQKSKETLRRLLNVKMLSPKYREERMESLWGKIDDFNPRTPGAIVADAFKKQAGVVERTIQDQVDNNEGWRKWFFSNNRQDDSGAMKHPLSSDALWLKKTSGFFSKHPYTESYKENKRQHDEMYQGEMPYDERSEFWPMKFQFKRMPLEIKKDYEMSLLKKAQAQVLKGGLADKKKDSDFDPKSIRKGMKVESEHTSNKRMQKEIAQDHLTEDKMYYHKLQKMEKEGSVLVKAKAAIGAIPTAAKAVKNTVAGIPGAIDTAVHSAFETTVNTAMSATKKFPKIQKAIVDHAHDPHLASNLANPIPFSTEAGLATKHLMAGAKKIKDSNPVQKTLAWAMKKVTK